MLCFRAEDILASDGGTLTISSLKLDILVSCRLRPLQMCLKTISVEFRLVVGPRCCLGSTLLRQRADQGCCC